MNIDTIHNVYFIGIGGIGMSAIARYFKAANIHVSGYDKTKTDVTLALKDLGINISFEDGMQHVPSTFLDKKHTLIVFTPAVPKSHSQLQYFRNQGFEVLKRSEVLGLITKNTFCMAVAGTHGKTTTTSILGHLMYQSGADVTAFLGGVTENYNSNLILGGRQISVVEADEFDRSFLTLSPNLACITSMDADHLDIYGDEKTLKESFQDFTKKIKPGGKLFVKKGLPIEGITYGVEEDADYAAKNVKIENGTYVFDLKTPKTVLKNLCFSLPGRHNLSNAVIALAMAIEQGCAGGKLIEALATYKGVKRRFTYHIKTKKLVYIDDYAHHPKEIDAVYEAVREMYPGKKVLVVFQPHLYSRTKDFIVEFGASLSPFNEIMLLDIYPARETPIKGVTSTWLMSHISNRNKQLVNRENLISKIKLSSAEVILTIGAGDIGQEVQKIKKELSVAI